MRKKNLYLPPVCGFLILVIALFPAGSSDAEIYSWKDENGKTHFTDNPAKIPGKYRRGEKKGLKTIKEAPPSADSPAPAHSPQNSFSADRLDFSRKYETPLTQSSGGSYLVKTLLNGKVEANLILDTGASLVTLSPGIAEKLGVDAGGNLPKLPFQTAGGTVWDPVLMLDKVQVGDALVKSVEASIGSQLEGIDGLLGMSFFDNFKMEINRAASALTLKPLADKGEKIWDKKPARWWKSKFDYYTGRIKEYGRMAGRLSDKTQAKDLKRTVRFYEDLHRKLFQRAALFGVPKEYQSSP